MTITIQNFEFFLLILVRITAFVYTAPFFSLKNVPIRVKTGLSLFIAIIIFYVIPVSTLEYDGTTIGYTVIVMKEAIAGAIMGLFANIAYFIIDFAGHMIDLEIGFSMVNEINPISNIQTTITANFYGYLVIIMMIITNLHHFFLRAVIESYQLIPVGDVIINPSIYKLMVDFMVDYFVIGFRIVLPIFTSILIVNTILGILAKVAPQMNMFVIGLQLKILVGFVILTLIIGLIPSVADFIFNEMVDMLKASIRYLT